MGSNDSLPPPVPPGEPPRVPPPPPAVPQFAPTEPIATTPPPPVTDQVPVTQVMAPVPPPPGSVPPPTGVPAAQPPAPDGEPSKQHLVPWIIGAAVLVVALVLVAVFALRGDDESSGTADTTLPSTAPTTTIEPATSVPTTIAPTTAPATVAPTTPSTSTTVAPTTTLPDAIVVADDTGVFTVLMLDTFEVATTPVDVDGVQLATVVGATDLAAFQSRDDHDTFGIGVSVGPSDQMPSVDDILAAADPGPSVCADRSTKTDYPTQLGSAQVLLLDGCGTGGLSAKVFFALTFPDRNLTMLVGSQGPGPSATDLFDFTQAVVESVVFL